ncbi:hypothetical protein B0H10DRAFT_2214167 [Mycena sp. CBHHK59/15]|nr:hypothetical protein B0H10DRAFT_2214167 [Mycena sp. CBHHK59/15]
MTREYLINDEFIHAIQWYKGDSSSTQKNDQHVVPTARPTPLHLQFPLNSPICSSFASHPSSSSPRPSCPPAPLPTSDIAVVEKRASTADITTVFNTLKGSTDTTLPQINALVFGGTESDATATPLINDLTPSYIFTPAY